MTSTSCHTQFLCSCTRPDPDHPHNWNPQLELVQDGSREEDGTGRRQNGWCLASTAIHPQTLCTRNHPSIQPLQLNPFADSLIRRQHRHNPPRPRVAPRDARCRICRNATNGGRAKEQKRKRGEELASVASSWARGSVHGRNEKRGGNVGFSSLVLCIVSGRWLHGWLHGAAARISVGGGDCFLSRRWPFLSGMFIRNLNFSNDA
jgi:hypothetical protein